MLKKILCAGLGVFGLFQSLSAITVINQTDTEKVIQIVEAYRPEPGKFPAALLKEDPEAVTVAPHSIQTIPLRTQTALLLVSITTTKKTEEGVTTDKVTTCYAPCKHGNQKAEFFSDDWGFVIHKPVVKKSAGVMDHFNFVQAKKNGYGIKCFDPLLLSKVTSLEELPEELK